MAKSSRRDKVDRRKMRLQARKAAKARARRRREEEEAAEDAAEIAALDPLGPLFLDEKGPLGDLCFDLSGLPAEPPEGDAGQALAEWFLSRLPALTGEGPLPEGSGGGGEGGLAPSGDWRGRARAALERLEGEAGAFPEQSHPARHAIHEALVWLDDALATGVATFHNIFYRFVFERSCERLLLAGRLPGWAGEVLALDPEAIRRRALDERRDRVAHRLTFGPFSDVLSPDDFPTAAPMISGPVLPPDEFTALTSRAADQDLTPERRGAAARRLLEAAGREEGEGRALSALDLRTLAAALESDDPVDQGLARLYYAHSVFRRREDATAADSVWPVA